MLINCNILKYKTNIVDIHFLNMNRNIFVTKIDIKSCNE